MCHLRREKSKCLRALAHFYPEAATHEGLPCKKSKKADRSQATWVRNITKGAANPDDKKKIERCHGPILQVPPDTSSPTQRQEPIVVPSAKPELIFGDLPPSLEERLPSFSDSIPRSIFQAVFYVLHLYAGHRRAGDVPDFVNALSGIHGFFFCFIPVDIVSQNQKHNACDPLNLLMYLDLIRRKVVHGVLCGPPCETWSAARFREIVDAIIAASKRKPPRPVRSVSDLYGIAGLAAREYSQLFVGNQLLFVSLMCFIECVGAGGLALIEHPADAGPDKPSIFKLPAIQRLLDIDIVRRTTFLQGKLGQISPKPTTVLTCRLPFILRFISSFSTATSRSNGGAQFDEQGNFATAEAKTYQPRFCAVIAGTLVHSIVASQLPDLQREFLFRDVRSRLLSLVQDYEQLQCSDFIPQQLPDCYDHPAELADMFEWTDDGCRGADFNLDSMLRRSQ